jgi:uncharacterized membrane protein
LRLFRKKKEFFSHEEQDRIVQAIQAAEKQTSGEIRVYVEGRCRFIDALDRAVELFYGLKMQETDHRNGVIVYVAIKDRQLAIFGDEGIHQKVGTDFWQLEVKKMLDEFNSAHFVAGIVEIVHDIGQALHHHFPYQREDKNELPDDIVFGS